MTANTRNITARAARLIIGIDRKHKFVMTNGDDSDSTLFASYDAARYTGLHYDGGAPGMFGRVVLITGTDNVLRVAIRWGNENQIDRYTISTIAVDAKNVSSIHRGILNVFRQI